MMNFSLIEQEAIFHFNTSSLSLSCFTLNTHMLSLLLQTPRDGDPMALLPLSLHQPRKKGGSVGWQTGNNIHLVTHTTLILSCRNSYLEIGWRGQWLLRQSVVQEHTQDIGLVLLCVSMYVWKKGGNGCVSTHGNECMYIYFKMSLETRTLFSSCPLSLDLLQWWGTHDQTALSAHSA